MRWECAAMASRVYDKNTRLVEGGRFATDVEKHVINAIRTERALV